MDEEIVLDRGNTTVMKLDADEQALMDEIEISAPRPKPVPRPVQHMHRPAPQQHQEAMDAFVNPNKQTAPSQPQQDEEIDYGEDEPTFYDDEPMGPGPQEEQPSKGYTSVDEEKADLINKLGRLEKKGFAVNKRLNAYSNVDELRSEVKRITYSIDVEQSVRFSRRMLVACVTGLEFLNKRYNPFEIQLEGWSESVMENVDDYDGVFEELYVKYRSKVSVAPEVKLIMMLGGSAMMFHLTNSMFKSVMPNMNDVMKQNPDLVKNMMAAVQNTTRSPGGPATEAPVGGTNNGQYEMQGPGLDISSLMGGIMMPPPPPMNTTMGGGAQESVIDDDDMSDIVSISGESTGGEVKEVNVSGSAKPKRTRRKKKTEINL
jgi:hypothetical protein